MTKISRFERRAFISGLAAIGFAFLAPAVSAHPSFSASIFLDRAPFVTRYQVKINQTAAGMLHDRALGALARQMAVDYGALRRDLEAFTPDAIVPPIGAGLPEDFPYNDYLESIIHSDTESIDDVFIDVSLEANHRAIALYKSYQAAGKDPKLVQIARKALAILKEHRRELRSFD